MLVVVVDGENAVQMHCEVDVKLGLGSGPQESKKRTDCARVKVDVVDWNSQAWRTRNPRGLIV